jgi:hypothetical protein
MSAQLKILSLHTSGYPAVHTTYCLGPQCDTVGHSVPLAVQLLLLRTAYRTCSISITSAAAAHTTAAKLLLLLLTPPLTSLLLPLLLLDQHANQPHAQVFDLADEASPVELDAAVCTFLAPDCALLALREGSLALLRLHPADSSMTLRTVGACPPAACLCATSHTTSLTESDAPQPVGESPKQAEEAETGLVFLGSHLGDSLLVGYSAVRGTAAVDASEWLSLMRVAVKQEEQEQGEGGWGDWKSDSPPEGEIRGDASGDSTAAVAVAAAVAAAADVSDVMDEGSDSGDLNGHADDECTVSVSCLCTLVACGTAYT